jgi:hypothetical protein
VELGLRQEFPELHEDNGVLEFTALQVQVKEGVY